MLVFSPQNIEYTQNTNTHSHTQVLEEQENICTKLGDTAGIKVNKISIRN